MIRCISSEDRDTYTDISEIISAMGDCADNYKWLVTNIETCNGKFCDREYVILSASELKELSDTVWIWGVFSAMPKGIGDDEILKFPLPYADDNTELYKDGAAVIQHPLAELEIVAFDSSAVLFTSKEERFAEFFKDLFPKWRKNMR